VSATSYPVDEAVPLARPSRAATRSTVFWAVVLLILVGHSEAVALSYNLVSPALTGIATTFKTTQVGWVFTALSLTGAVLTPVICKLADIYGKKKAIVAITFIATAGCVVAATATSFAWVLAGRIMEGFFLALIPLTYSLMRDTFPKKMLAFAVTIAASGVGIVTISGPFLAGYLVDHHGWRSVFWFLFALQLVGGLLVLAVVPESPVRNRVRIDWLGATLIGAGVGILLLGLSMGATWHWGDTRTLACLAAGLALLATWVVAETRVNDPLMDLGLLRSRPITTIMITSMFGGAALAGAATLLPMMVQTPHGLGGNYGFGLTAEQVVRFTVPAGVLTVLFGFALGAVIRRLGARAPMIAGALLSVAGGLGLAFAHSTQAGVLISFALFGIAQALVFSSLPNLVIASVPVEQQAISAGMTNTMQALGTAAGTQVLFVILTGHVAKLIQGTPIYANTGYTAAFVVAAGFAVIAVIAALAVPLRRASA
jgi:MFS family permease